MTEMSHSIAGLPAASVPGGEAQTMSTLEIAELTGKRHDNIMVDVRNMLFQLDKDGLTFQGNYRDSMNREKPCYHLPQRECLILVSGYSIPMRAKIIDRWQELEQRQPTPAPAIDLNDPAALRGLLLTHTEKVIELQGQIAAQAPKLEAYARIAEADGSLCIRDAAKSLQIRPIDLKNYLVANGWIYKRPGTKEWSAYQPKLGSLLLRHKTATIPHEDGHDRIRTQVRVTPKGLARLAEEMAAA
ncbi:phage antirepressor YoqD-like protein [Methylobacterium sp. RAS18]|nr:phage antirepressor YoqD-like protein [Methylobacterium sp. RAS18]